ncbi:gamma-glutamylcyclotransferase (GGCT)/AIG2-like uncharacterized protein YtfP [Saccharomonospora amisosensis]|uniref:Putative gamma-glutamylcyclotransferase n=1 Tax=Saccharomonospora amisosensis TaxID=1128677 RepID=A0A7X5UNP1_9PSEU|nr:gamma-glutamylcyclotransferase family protein [Saccharomonospora amisosensis]NIJ11373.1 gamma-glutamylcyclotransferase (GGCT)/AIG2-like uncharacterized protein YtfP [Saccharomonospora amisosensis]
MTARLPGRLAAVAAGPAPLFVYGTLRFAAVLEVLLGRVPTGAPSAAVGWRAAALRGRCYPVLVPGSGRVDGLLLTDLAPDEWRVLDEFEDDFYDLIALTLTEGQRAYCYACPHAPGLELDGDWDAESFARRELPGFVAGCGQWRAEPG